MNYMRSDVNLHAVFIEVFKKTFLITARTIYCTWVCNYGMCVVTLDLRKQIMYARIMSYLSYSS